MIGTEFSAIGGEGDDIHSPGMATEGITRNDERGMPVEDAFLLDAWRQRRIPKVNPVHHAELHGCLIRQRIR